MIEASKLKAGMTFETADGKLIRVLEASHHKPGKGNTIMRMKLRDVRTGSTFDTSYRPEEKFEQAIIETVPALETGLVVNVPDFIEVGQKLIINTAEGTYVSRA